MFDSFNIYFGRNVKQFKTIAPVRIKKLIIVLQKQKTRSICRTFPKTHRFLEKYIKTCHNNQQIKKENAKANLQN